MSWLILFCLSRGQPSLWPGRPRQVPTFIFDLWFIKSAVRMPPPPPVAPWQWCMFSPWRPEICLAMFVFCFANCHRDRWPPSLFFVSLNQETFIKTRALSGSTCVSHHILTPKLHVVSRSLFSPWRRTSSNIGRLGILFNNVCFLICLHESGDEFLEHISASFLAPIPRV